MRVVLPVQEVARHVAQVDGLDEDVAPRAGGLGGGPAQVADAQVLERFALHPRRHHARQHVDARAAQRLGILQSLVHPGAELGLAPRLRRCAARLLLPCGGHAGAVSTAGRRVEQHQLQSVVREPRGDVGGLEGVGKLKLHRREPVARSSGKAVQKRQLGVHQAQVGGKLGHGGRGRKVESERSSLSCSIGASSS
ncbi:hypothetical protein D3C72_1809080 [compost metagenome]